MTDAAAAPGDDDPRVPVFVPSLASVLLAQEDALGRALDADDVATAIAAANVVMVPLGAALAQQRDRGFRDLDPDDAYAEYLALRAHLGRP